MKAVLVYSIEVCRKCIEAKENKCDLLIEHASLFGVSVLALNPLAEAVVYDLKWDGAELYPDKKFRFPLVNQDEMVSILRAKFGQLDAIRMNGRCPWR